jgi:predicted transposase YbfD/YdcC
MLSAWASTNELVLGHLATKGNEITAIPQLLAWLDLAGATVTLEAMGCHKDIAGQIVEQGGDSVLAVKDPHNVRGDQVALR